MAGQVNFHGVYDVFARNVCTGGLGNAPHISEAGRGGGPLEKTQKEWGVGRIVPKNRATGWGITTKLCKTGGPRPEVQILETHGLPEQKVILRGRVRSVVAILEVQASGGNEMFLV